MFAAQLIDRIGWTLIHSIWQIFLLACVVAVCNRFVFRKSAGGRYVFGCLALLAMTSGPVITFLTLTSVAADRAVALAERVSAGTETAAPARQRQRTRSPNDRGVQGRAINETDPATKSTAEMRNADEANGDRIASASRVSDSSDLSTRVSSSLVGWQDRSTTWLQRAMPLIVLVWFIGALLLSVRPLVGLYTVRRLYRQRRSEVPEPIRVLVRRLCERMGIEQTIEVAESGLLQIPAVVGTLRPLLLLPATAVTGLTPAQLEVVIAHELAHVRRHDYFVNLLQTMVETVFFYHPAVWWVSAAVRRERENCCDDMAVAVCDDRAAYAKTLLMLDQLQAVQPHAVVAANGGSLLKRIRRLMGSDEPEHGVTTWLAGEFLFIALLTLAASFTAVTPAVIAGDDDGQPNVRLRLRDSAGKRLTKPMNWQSAYRGWRAEMPNAFYASDERGKLNMLLQPGKHAIVAGLRHNARIVEFDVPAGGLKANLNLPKSPGTPWPPVGSGYPDLNVRAAVREGKQPGEEFIVLTIANNKETPYTLQPTDCTLTTTDLRVYPPRSQQQTGVVIPPKGEKVISLAWHEYVRGGIWTWRNEPISEPWPATEPKPGRVWFRPNVGITGSLPIQVTMPKVILDPKSFDPRTLIEHSGGLRGRFVFAGQRPQPTRLRAAPRSTLDGRKFDLSDDLVLKENEVNDESLVIGPKGGIANIVVWIHNKDVPVPLVDRQHVSLRIKSGRFDPHITLLQPGQDLSISNEEKFGVNFHLQTVRNPAANLLLQANHSISRRFESAEPGPVSIKCNIHPWMSGWMILRDTPFMAVTAADGVFEIKGIPPGEWEFQFWHEKTGYLKRESWPQGRATIEVKDEIVDLGTVKLDHTNFNLAQSEPASEAKPTNNLLPSDHPLRRALAALDKKRVLELLQETPQLIDRPSEKGFTMLHSISLSGKQKQVELLLEVGADPNVKQTRYGGTPLQYAAYKGHLEVCQLLISHDAAVDAIDMYGRTPLMWAALQGNAKVAAFLIEHGAEVNAQTTGSAPGNQSGKGATALHLAVEKKHDEVVALLLKHGADRNLPNAAGLTPYGSQAPKQPSDEAAAADQWYRDAPYPEIGFAQPDEIDRTYVRIVSHPPAHRELGVSETQAAVLRQLGAWAMQDFYDPPVNDRAARNAVWAKARRRADNLLNQQQRLRLNQLVIQQRRTEVFMNAKFLPELQITDEQRAKIHAKWRQHLKRISAESLRNAENARAGHLSYRQFWAAVREILTVEQRNRYEQLRGPAVAKVQPDAGNKRRSRQGQGVDARENRGDGTADPYATRPKAANDPDTTDPSDESAAEKVGEVFGKPIYRQQLPRKDKDNAVRDQLFRLIIRPVMERYRNEHADDIELTDAEILAAIQFFEARAAKNGGRDAKWWQGIVSREQLDSLRQIEAGEQALEKNDSQDAPTRKAIERQLAIARKSAKHPGYSFINFFLGNLKFQRHLYDNFGGGRILFQQAGLEAFDAMHNWLLQHEQDGDFQVSDPKLRAKIYEYWTRDHGAFLQGEQGKTDPAALTLKGIYAEEEAEDN